MNGLDAITDLYEKTRQLYSLEHDIEHGSEVLVRAGASYADFSANRMEFIHQDEPHPFWPNGWEWDPGNSDIETLTKAAVLIASALDVIFAEMRVVK